jgi:hypothetical protein
MVTRDCLRFIFLTQPGTNEHIFISWKDIFMLRVTPVIKCVSDICAILEDQLADLT